MSNVRKKIVCLSKSRKSGGFCIAGKEIYDNGTIGGWIRPVSSREKEEISANECECENSSQPILLDIVEIPLKKHKPNCFQCENYLIDETATWSKKGRFNRKLLNKICDSPEDLWDHFDSTKYGLRDIVDENDTCKLQDSLNFITPTCLTISVGYEGERYGIPNRNIRVKFEYNKTDYSLYLTHRYLENRYYGKKDGEYVIKNPTNRVFMCISIGLPWGGLCYKFVASIIGL